MLRTTTRISAVVEPDLYDAVESMARRDHMSVSQKARDLLRQAAEQDEDADLIALVAERRRRGGKSISHEELKARLKKL